MDEQKNKPPDNRKLSAAEQQLKAVNEQLEGDQPAVYGGRKRTGQTQ